MHQKLSSDVRRTARSALQIATLSIAVAFTGCVSHLVTSSRLNSTNPGGIVYSLPKQLLQVRFTRENVNLEKLVAQVSVLNSSLAALAESIERQEQEIKKLKAEVDAATGTSRAALEGKLALAELELGYLTAQKNETATKLDVANSAISNFKPNSWTDTFSLNLQAPIPDPDQLFIANIEHRKSRTDALKITTTSNGLLEGFVGTADDKTNEIIVEAISSLARIVSVRDLSITRTESSQQTTPIAYEHTFDPTNTQAVQQVSGELSALAGYTLDISLLGPSPSATSASNDTVNGLYYRRPLPYDVAVKKNGVLFASKILLVANRGPIARVELPVSSGVKTEYNAAFKDGMFVSLDSTRPSEGLAAAKIIPDILSAIIAIPTDLIQFKIDYSTKEKALADARLAQIQSQVALLSAQQGHLPSTSSGDGAK